MTTDLGWINVKDYGAVGDGVADDTAALQAAIGVAAASSGVVYFPVGKYNFTHLDVRTTNGSLTLRGDQGYQWWGPTTAIECRTILHCTATDALDCIAAFQIQGFIVQDIEFSYANGYTGILLNLGGDGGVGSNTCLIKQCHFISDRDGTYKTAKAFIGLANTVCTVIEDCSFMGSQSLIRGYAVAENFSTDVIISRCSFERCTVGQIVNPSMWVMNECTFEFTDAETPCAITSDLDHTAVGGNAYQYVILNNCWFWDVTSGTQKAIVQPPGVYWDLRVRDCWFHTFDNKHVELNGPGTVVIDGCTFAANVPSNTPTLIDLGDSATAPKSLISIVGNCWNAGSPTDNANTILNYAGHANIWIHNNTNTGPWATVIGTGGGAPYDPLLGTVTLTTSGVVAIYSGVGVSLSGDNTYYIENPVSIAGNLYLGGDLLMGQSGSSHTVTYGNIVGNVPCHVSLFGSLALKAYPGMSPLNLAVSIAPTTPIDGDVWREDNTDTGLKIRINGVTRTIAVD